MSTSVVELIDAIFDVKIISICRSADVRTRQRYVALFEGVKDGGGTVRVFSSLHVSGERKALSVRVARESVRLYIYLSW